MFNPDALKIEKKPEIKEEGSVFNLNELNKISKMIEIKRKKEVEFGDFERLIRIAGIANETDPRIEKSLEIIATFAENPKNGKKVIDGLYGIPGRKGWLEEEESTARLALNRILESGIKLIPKSMLTVKEIELIAGIKGINSGEDIKKIHDVYSNISVAKIAKDLKINRNEVYPILSILVNPTDRQKRILKTLYDTEEGKKIHISGIAKSLGIAISSMPPSEVLRYMDLVKLNEKKEIVKKNKNKFKEIYQDIESWSIKKEETEKKKRERAKRGESTTQAIQIIVENIKETGINMEKISNEEIEKLIKNLSRGDFIMRGIDIHPNINNLKHTLLKKIERGELIPEIKNYMSKNT